MRRPHRPVQTFTAQIQPVMEWNAMNPSINKVFGFLNLFRSWNFWLHANFRTLRVVVPVPELNPGILCDLLSRAEEASETLKLWGVLSWAMVRFIAHESNFSFCTRTESAASSRPASLQRVSLLHLDVFQRPQQSQTAHQHLCFKWSQYKSPDKKLWFITVFSPPFHYFTCDSASYSMKWSMCVF